MEAPLEAGRACLRASMAACMLGTPFPNFSAKSQVGNIHVHDLIGESWLMIFSVATAFDATATTELGMVAKLQSEFDARRCKVLAISMETAERHESWGKATEETQSTTVDFPILADEDGSILHKLHMRYVLDGEPRHVIPAVIIVDPSRTVRWQMTSAPILGRNFWEVLRVLDSLQLTSLYDVGTPAHWKAPEDVFVLPHVGDEQALLMFPKGVTKLPTTVKGLPPCRVTPYPGPMEDGDEDLL